MLLLFVNYTWIKLILKNIHDPRRSILEDKERTHSITTQGKPQPGLGTGASHMVISGRGIIGLLFFFNAGPAPNEWLTWWFFCVAAHGKKQCFEAWKHMGQCTKELWAYAKKKEWADQHHNDRTSKPCISVVIPLKDGVYCSADGDLDILRNYWKL